MKTYKEIIETAQTLGLIAFILFVVVSCCNWIERDEKRMFTEFMETCKAQKLSTDCGAAYLKAYRETFGK